MCHQSPFTQKKTTTLPIGMEPGFRVRMASLLFAMCDSFNLWFYYYLVVRGIFFSFSFFLCVCVCARATLMLGKDRIILFKIFKGLGFLCWVKLVN